MLRLALLSGRGRLGTFEQSVVYLHFCHYEYSDN